MAKKATGNAQGLGGVNQATPLGQSQPSSNEWMGIDPRVAKGTTGSRPDSSATILAGDQITGQLFKGPAVGAPMKEMNSGKAEKQDSASTGQYGPGGAAEGGYGSRENMTIGSGTNAGKYFGDGVNSTPVSTFDRFFGNLPVQPGMDLEHGTSNHVKNENSATKGLGKRKTTLPKHKD